MCGFPPAGGNAKIWRLVPCLTVQSPSLITFSCQWTWTRHHEQYASQAICKWLNIYMLMFDICQTPTYLVFEDIFSHREIEYFSGFFFHYVKWKSISIPEFLINFQTSRILIHLFLLLKNFEHKSLWLIIKLHSNF